MDTEGPWNTTLTAHIADRSPDASWAWPPHSPWWVPAASPSRLLNLTSGAAIIDGLNSELGTTAFTPGLRLGYTITEVSVTVPCKNKSCSP